MILSEVDLAFYEGLRDVLVPAGFKPRKKDYEFKRATSFGFQEVIFAILDYEPKFIFSFGVAIRFDAIQDAVAPFSGISPEYRAQAFTVHVRPQYFTGEDLRAEVYSLADVAAALSTATTLLREYFFPFLDKCDCLAAAEQILNRDPEYRYSGDYVYKAICGVAAAALCQRSDLLEIVERYRQELSAYIEPLRNRFEAAVTYLTTPFLAK